MRYVLIDPDTRAEISDVSPDLNAFRLAAWVRAELKAAKRSTADIRMLPSTPSDINPDDHTKAELVELVEARGVAISLSATKAELAAALNESR